MTYELINIETQYDSHHDALKDEPTTSTDEPGKILEELSEEIDPITSRGSVQALNVGSKGQSFPRQTPLGRHHGRYRIIHP